MRSRSASRPQKTARSPSHAKAFETVRANADANFDFLKAMFAAKSLPELVTLQTEFARKQVETITGQTKDFGAMAQKAMADAVEPIKEQAARVVQARGLSLVFVPFGGRVPPRAVIGRRPQLRAAFFCFRRARSINRLERKPCATWALSLIIPPTRSGRHSSVG